MDLEEHGTGLEMSTQEGGVTEIVGMLEKKRDEAVEARQEIESRWLRDLQQFEGNTLDRMTKGDTDYRSAVRKQPPVVHLTRTRTLSIAARIINMLVPSNERSWNIEPTPVPQLNRLTDDESPVMDPRTGQLAMIPDSAGPDAGQPPAAAPLPQPGGDMAPPGPPGPTQAVPPGAPQPINGQAPPGPPGQPGPEQPPMRPVTKADLARHTLEEADKRADRMRDHMDDQLVEARYNAEQRKVILDGCKIGTGVLEGPVVGGKYKKRRQQLADGQWVMQMEEEPAPQFKCIDPWNFYPLPAEHVTKSEGVFIDQLMTRRELQELKMLPGFDAEMIDEILREKPHHSQKYSSSLTERANVTGETMPTDKRYAIWKYTGSLDREDMEALDVDVDEDLDLVDPIIEAWFCNTRLLKIKRHALEGQYRLPYYVWNYEESETSMFGYGVPYLMRDSDRVIQSTWHMILHNAALSAGPMLVRHKGAIEPADGSQEISGGLKQWFFSDPEKTVDDAFKLFQIDARIDELVAVHERARQNADEELAFPLLAQGEPTEAVPTSSGMAMLMNASNVVQRRIAQSYDDEVIEPSITALYDYNMIYLDDDDAKGDMQIAPQGATKLVVKDMQTQHLIVIANMTTNDRFAPLMKDDELLRAILKSAEVDPDQFMKSDEEMQGMGPSPMEVAELEHRQAETEKVRAEAQKLMQAEPMEGGMTEKDMAETQLAYDRMEVDVQVAQMKLEEAALEASKSSEIKLADIQTRFELGQRAEETKRLIAEMQERRKQITEGYMARLKAKEIAQKEANLRKGFDTYG